MCLTIQMFQGPFRISILALILLSAYNILLTLKLMYTPECENMAAVKHIVKIAKKCDTQPPNQGYHLDLRLGRKDNSLQYKMYDNILLGETYTELSEIHKTCIATQSSLDKIHSLVEMSTNWNGPISIATFATTPEELKSLVFSLLYLRECFAHIKDQVAFHLAIPEALDVKTISLDLEHISEVPCDNPLMVLRGLTKKYKLRSKKAYPQNHLRNLARKNCQTKFVFLVDVDIIPSRNMAVHLDAFLQTATCRKLCAFVIPTYEIDDRVRFPENKSELIRLANKGLARPFHHKVFIYNQFATNFSRWQNASKEMEQVHVSHPVTNFEFLYEPFYVAEDSVPAHDERFVGYGYTRNSQVYEMFVAGYEFLVLSPIFTCHWGLQVKRTRPAWREQQNVKNRKKFHSFKWEIFAKYDRDPLDMTSRRKN